ncbi:MAG: hypothetical protein A2044_05495 [Candidatus Firestonebacteria bacterium GWA2_43_8]|nr:MAG: hypothetical protein A2044_05495 [Candidatus Firestonebacteria bacterium GWA2_43_8]
MGTKNLKQKVLFAAEPEKVYSLLMDSKKHSAFTGAKAVISPKEGGKFSAYDGYNTGVNVKLIPGKLIKQTWRASDWEDGYYSEVTFKFKAVKNGTEMEFTHKGIPAEQYADIKNGWIEYYWTPMKSML